MSVTIHLRSITKAGQIQNSAGYHSPSKEAEYRNVCSEACKQALSVLRSGGSSVDAVALAVKFLENAECTNAGRGSNMTLDGSVECDASIMDGKTLLFGAVGAISDVKNPILVAKKLVECQKEESMSLGRIPPCIMVGKGASEWAKNHGIEHVSPESLKTESSMMTYNKHKRKLDNLEERLEVKRRKHLTKSLDKAEKIDSDINSTSVQDTVGAVCVDCQGNLAAGVSSGGISLKQPGRLGPAAVYGAGCWAYNQRSDRSGVAVATSGSGEHIMRTLLAKECADQVQQCEIPAEALHYVFSKKFIESEYLESVKEKLGGALVLRVQKRDDKKLDVELLWGHTTDSMCLGYMCTKPLKSKTLISRLPDGKKAGTTLTLEGRHFVL